MSARVDRWRTSPLGIAAVAAGIGVVFSLAVWPRATAAAGGAVIAAVVLVLGARRLMRELRAGQTDPAADPAPAYRRRHALAFNAITRALSDSDDHVRLSVRDKAARAVLDALDADDPDASGQDPDPIRTTPNTTGQQATDRAGHDPDTIRTRLAAALHEDPHADWHYLTGRAAEIREGRDRADAECNRLRRMVDEYSAGARGLSDNLRAARDAVAEAIMCRDLDCLTRSHLPKIAGILGGVGLLSGTEPTDGSGR